MIRGLPFVVLALLGAIATGDEAMATEPKVIFDFRSAAPEWPSIDDRVMGGVSSSRMVLENGHASFRGTVSFDNNGGFASIRSLPQVRDLSGFDGLVLRVRGDGKRYGFRIRTSATFDGVSYQVVIDPPAGKWVDVDIRFEDFVPVHRGRVVDGHPSLDPSRITTMGLIVSRQEGRFRIDVETISGLPSEPE
jgi:hypothetical protein